MSAAALAEAYAAGRLNPSEVAEDVIARITERERVLNAFYVFDAGAVRAAAAASSVRWAAGAPRSPLDGVPVTVKENIPRRGVPVPAGTALPNPPVAQENSPIVDRLEEAGLVILGSTTMPDYGMLSSGVSSRHGITRNAWDPALTSGGSSAGAGTAAAAGYGPLHVGTDIGGSVRLPATWAGLAALKPSPGLVPLHEPYTGRAAGPITRSVDDAALLMTVIGRPDRRDYSSRPYPAMDWFGGAADPAGLRIGLQLDAGSGIEPDPEVLDAVSGAAGLFAAAGARVEVLPPFMAPEQLKGVDDFWRTKFYAQYSRLCPQEQELILPYVAEWCRRGARCGGVETVANFHRMAEIQQAAARATGGFDLMLSPVAPMAAFPAEWPMPQRDPALPMGHISFTLPYNMSGQPAASVNCGFTADGRTIGLQIAGQVAGDDRVLAAARWYEKHRPPSAVPDWGAVA
ncbi:amidase [Arthrobacter sp. I2-34]|uniref:Amidase n=2 Tax=Arthrobacter hankyongi TaxID=2904801 RepID=A0ABS9L7J0_9MICC|nr:amidase [Arthrobacter hankyongi]